MTTILALDASTERCSVALLERDKLLEKVSIEPRSHANKLLPMVDEVLAEAGIDLKQVQAVAFGAGPGSFTGLRICVGVVQGLAFGADLPVVPISSLKAMAYAARRAFPEAEFLLPAIDARMDEVYWASYDALSDSGIAAVHEPRVSPVSSTDETLCQWLADKKAVGIGSGWTRLSASKASLWQCTEDYWPAAGSIAHLAVDALERGLSTCAAQAEPVYLRTEISWNKRKRIRR